MTVPVSPGAGQGKANRYLWVVLPVAFSVALAQSLSRMGIPALYPFIQDEFGLSRAQVGLITSAYAIGILATVMLGGWLADTLGVKRVITGALLSMTLFTLAFPLAFSFPVVLAIVAIIGIASSPIYPSTSRAVMDWFPGRIRALAVSVLHTGFPIGGALTAAVLPALAVTIGWRLTGAATGLLVLATAIVFVWLYRDAPRGAPPAGKFDLAVLRSIFRNRSMVISIGWGATFVGFQFVVMTYFMLFLIETLGFSPVMAGGMLAVAQIASGFSRPAWGAASDFIFRGRRKTALAIIGFLTAGWMMGASFIGEGAPGFAIYLIAVGIGLSTLSFHGVQTTVVGELAEPGQIGVTLGFSSTINHASLMLMPPLFGFLADLSGSYRLGWQVTAALALVCTLALLAFGREPQRS